MQIIRSFTLPSVQVSVLSPNPLQGVAGSVVTAISKTHPYLAFLHVGHQSKVFYKCTVIHVFPHILLSVRDVSYIIILIFGFAQIT